MDEVESIHFENDLLYAARETLSIKGFPLNPKNYCTLIKVVLSYILVKNDYGCITENNQARRLISKYDKLSIISYLCNKIAIHKSESISNVNRKYSDNLIDCVLYYSNNILPNIITDKWLQTYKPTGNTIVGEIKNVNFYKPSNSCREAVLSGRQLEVSSSIENYMEMSAQSDMGKVAKNQEDSYYIGVHPDNKEFKIMVVADGMGGQKSGENASSFAILHIIKWFEKLSATEFYQNDYEHLISLLEEEIYNIHYSIKRHFPDSGTTLCLCMMRNNNIFLCNIGDSFGFVLKNNKLLYSTKPDNTPESLGIPIELNRFHVYSNLVTNCIGGRNLPDLNCVCINTKEENKYDIVLCTDGVTDCISIKQILQIIVDSNTSNEVVNKLVTFALNNTSNFKTEYNNYLGSIVSRQKYNEMYEFLKECGLDEKTEEVIIGGKDNTTAIATSIYKRR